MALAVAYYLVATRLQHWAWERKFMVLPLVAIGGFIGRLAVFTGILVALGLWSPLNIVAVCLAFVVVFTILNGIWIYSLVTKRHRMPPSAGTTRTS